MRTIQDNFDVVVSGGGLAGVCAALQAARSGARTALLEEKPVLGGNSSSYAGVPPHGATAIGHNRYARETGICEELRMAYAELSPHADNRQFWDFTLREWCNREQNLSLFLNTKVLAVETSSAEKDRPKTVAAVEAVQTTTETRFRFSGKVFVDATGDALVAAEAGAAVRLGREGREEFTESLAPEKPDPKTLGSTIYLIAFRRDYPVPFAPPRTAKKRLRCEDYPLRHHEISAILPGNSLSPDDSTFRVFWWMELGGERDIIRENEEIYEELQAELFGLWDHLKNHCAEETRKALANYDLVWWSTIPLKRGSRRIEGDYMMTEDDVFNPKPFADRIGYGGFPIDLHPAEGIRSLEAPCLQTFLNDLYAVPFRSIYSRDLGNLLLAGRCLSASFVALGSLRLMFTLGSLGQAAGLAAALCAAKGVTPRELGASFIGELQQALLKADLTIPGLRNLDPADLARSAQAEATSVQALRADANDGFLTLVYATAQQFPAKAGTLAEIKVLLKATGVKAASVRWSLHAGNRLGFFEDTPPLAQGELKLAPGGARWYGLGKGLNLASDTLLWIKLDRSPEAAWGFAAEEVLGTRLAVSYEGPLEPNSFHGKAVLAPRKSSWLSPNHHGRLPAQLERDLEAAMTCGWRRKNALVRKPYVTLNFIAEGLASPYAAANVVNGAGRTEDWPNLWISDPDRGLPQSLSLTWPETGLDPGGAHRL